MIRELPAGEGLLYREALLEPVGLDEGELSEGKDRLDALRTRVKESLAEGPLARLSAAETILDFASNEEVPTSAILEVLSFTIVTDGRTRYRLLEEGDARRRADIIESEVNRLERLIRMAAHQHPSEWPKGMSWN